MGAQLFSNPSNWIRDYQSEEDFERAAIQVFRHQAASVPVYNNYLRLLNVAPDSVERLADIPFLPVSFFKTHEIKAAGASTDLHFTSSGTTGSAASNHYVADKAFYHQSFMGCFERFYGNAADWAFLCLLPSYLERSGSSLVYMAKHMVAQSPERSGFFLDEFEQLKERILQHESEGIQTLLLGVSFALLDFGGYVQKLDLKHTVVMETGGMKGRRAEITRMELHDELKTRFGTHHIHSEYGMTELLSQAYSQGNGSFQCPPWMRVMIRDLRDPFHILQEGRSGAINIIDLANVHSCSFIETQDVGRLSHDRSFEVLGRMDASDIRGCNLMVD